MLELDNENFTTVARDELRYLHQKSTQADQLTEENSRLGDELKGYDEATLRVEALEKENKLLKAEIQQHKLQSIGTPTRPETPVPSDPSSSVPIIADGESNVVPRGKYNNLVEKYDAEREKYNNLVVKHNKMHKSYVEFKSANQNLQESFEKEQQKNKDWNSTWASHTKDLTKKDEKIQRQEKEIRALSLKLGAPAPCPPWARTNDWSTDIPGSVIQVARSPARSTFDEDIGRQSDLIGTEQPKETGDRAPSPGLPNLLKEGQFGVDDTQFIPIEAGHSSSTEDEPISPQKPVHEISIAKAQVPAEHSPSDDLPVVISTRRVKKRKMRDEHLESTPVSKIKVEDVENSPIGLAALRYTLSESIDLDDIGEKVDTPKKRRHVLELSRQVSELSNSTKSQMSRGSQNEGRTATSTESLHELPQETPARRIVGDRAGSALQPLSTNSRILPRTSDERLPKKRRIASDEAIEALLDSGHDVSAQVKTSKRPAAEGTGRLGNLLGKPSPEKRILSPTHVSRIESPNAINQHTRSKASATSGLAQEIRNSNGYDSDAPARSRKSKDSLQPARLFSRGTPQVSPTRPSSKGATRDSMEPARLSPRHLDRQLEKLSDDRKIQPRTSVSSRNDRDSAGPSKLTPAQTKSHKSVESTKALTRSKPRLYVEDSEPEWDDDLENEPLRTRPLETLNLEDFKINPNYNQGLDYAFVDVVRGKDKRRCLQGCTKPECCGNQFRAMAELLIDNGRVRTLSQEDQADELLAEFMGGNAYKIANMSKAEKQEMYIKAKTWDLANKNGRHRHAYESMKSPPGFWDTDFPTTQEEQVNRENSKKYYRDLVASRYEQAMRPGGSYIFRDE